MNERELQGKILANLRNQGITKNASIGQIYMASSRIVRDLLMEKWVVTQDKCEKLHPKQVYYLSMEFLVGRSLKNHLFNLGLTELFRRTLQERFNVKLDDVFEVERDAGLGNGGLGRLAACYQDALATSCYPSWGFSILYEYGIFKQRILEGHQVELPDVWLDTGGVWLVPKHDETVEIHFGGIVEECYENGKLHFNHKNYDTVLAVPHDMIISGFNSPTVSTLRLWQAKCPEDMNMELFNGGEYVRAFEHKVLCETISKVLYPEDAHLQGKELRIKQQYFFVSATIQFIIARHKATFGTLTNFAEYNAIHINDTHPAVAIPELMRILIDEEGFDWGEAWNITSNCIAYTNHTVMAEALERWPASIFRILLPRIYQIICEINRRFTQKLHILYPEDDARIAHLSIIYNDEMRMANLCVASTFSTNGVSELHSDILKKTVFSEFYSAFPERFHNVTNGIAHRRWLAQANPHLYELICDLIGDQFIKEPEHLSDIIRYQNDHRVLFKLAEIKAENKEKLAKVEGLRHIDNAIFDVQAKRLHEYKRQLLNIMRILRDYYRILDTPGACYQPKAYLFAAKAAPGYVMAKQVIQLIHSVASEIEAHPIASRILQVKFLADYSVTLAERMIPAAEISEQISIAGKEASGTGNMKFMLNGALTLGTMDGANVEILDAVGYENIYIFGMKSDEVERVTREKSYFPKDYYREYPEIARILDHLRDGIGKGTLRGAYPDIVNAILTTDTYMVLKDFNDYCRVSDKMSEDYSDPIKWNRSVLTNIAGAGRFAADRSIREYAENIWGITPLKI